MNTADMAMLMGVWRVGLDWAEDEDGLITIVYLPVKKVR